MRMPELSREGAGEGGSKQLLLVLAGPAFGQGAREMFVRATGGDAPARRAVDEPDLEEERLVDVFAGVRLLADGGGQRPPAHGGAPRLVPEGAEVLAAHPREACAGPPQQGAVSGRE